ncbi:unnamed protein product, partial [Phaeothamnion confervicola]
SAGSGGSSPLDMLWSGGRRTRPDEVTVNIERTSLNSRRISGSIVVDAPIEDVWLVLTDYDKLAEYVPNLTQSRLVPHPRGGIRLFQEGAQKIVGFDFRASLVMDMEEKYGEADDRLAQRKITFKLVDSGMFNDFDGEWRLQFNSRQSLQVNRDALPGEDRYKYTTKLFYMVYIRPRGPVPVLALEWQIGQEVPNNLAAVKKAAEMMGTDAAWVRRRLDESARFRVAKAAEAAAATAGPGGASPAAQVRGEGRRARSPAASAAEGRSPPRADWEKDETLEAYIQKISKGSK